MCLSSVQRPRSCKSCQNRADHKHAVSDAQPAAAISEHQPNGLKDKPDNTSNSLLQTHAEPEVINSAEFAKRLGVPETWVRSRSNPKRTDDPIPHYKFGRYVQFPWGSEEMQAWLKRQLVVSTNRVGHSRRIE